MLIYIIPEYIEGMGDCCKVKRREGEVLLPKKMNTVFKEVFREYCTDFCAIRKITTNILNQKTLVPIYVSAMEIMIPIKVRLPLFKGDCCYGYVNFFEIKRVFHKDILLMNGERIAYLGTKRAIQRREHMAETLSQWMPDRVKDRFLNGFGQNRSVDGSCGNRCGIGRELGIPMDGSYGRDQGHRTEYGLDIEIENGDDAHPSMPAVVEDYILNLVYWAMENKSLMSRALDMDKCN